MPSRRAAYRRGCWRPHLFNTPVVYCLHPHRARDSLCAPEMEMIRESRARDKGAGVDRNACIVDRNQFFNTQVRRHEGRAREMQLSGQTFLRHSHVFRIFARFFFFVFLMMSRCWRRLSQVCVVLVEREREHQNTTQTEPIELVLPPERRTRWRPTQSKRGLDATLLEGDLFRNLKHVANTKPSILPFTNLRRNCDSPADLCFSMPRAARGDAGTNVGRKARNGARLYSSDPKNNHDVRDLPVCPEV